MHIYTKSKSSTLPSVWAWIVESNQKWLLNFCGADCALARESPTLTSGRETIEQWDPTQPQVPSGLQPKNFPLLSCTTNTRARKSIPWVSTFSLLNPENKGIGGLGFGVYIMEWGEKMERILVWVRGKRHEVCRTTSQIPNMLLSLALSQRFNRAVLGAVQYLQFPLTLADRGFTLTLSFSDYFLFCVFYRRSDGTSHSPGK